MKKEYFFFVLFCVIFITPSYAKHLYSEKTYCDKWCSKNNGKTETTNSDNSRSDCVTNTHVFEFEFAEKAYEAIGQSLWYGIQNPDKIPGVVLIIEKRKDYKKWIQLNSLILYYNLPIETYYISPEYMKEK